MKATGLKKLRVGGDIIHKRYGVCNVIDILYSLGSFFGVVIRPKTRNGRELLRLDSGTDITDYMEDSLRRLKI